jgi:hypothetical protein
MCLRRPDGPVSEKILLVLKQRKQQLGYSARLEGVTGHVGLQHRPIQLEVERPLFVAKVI